MSEPFLGQIQMFGFNFAPRGWSFCDGQLLPISQNTALFSLLGTTFGGDGRTTFALPDLRGRDAIHPGNGPGLPQVRWGQKGGRNTVTLTIANLPSHNHTVGIPVTTAEGDQSSPAGNVLAENDQGNSNFHETAEAGEFLKAPSVGNTGGSQSFDITNPYLGIYHSIAMQGIFPSRS